MSNSPTTTPYTPPPQPLVAVVTGGGTGIGKAQAMALSRIPGAQVIITGRRKEPLQQTQTEIGVDQCHIVPNCDTGSIESWTTIAALITELGGALHVLCNTSGAILPSGGPAMGPYEHFQPEHIVAYNTSYISGLQLSYHFLAPFLIRGAQQTGKPSSVINMSSINSSLSRGLASYSPFYHPCKCAVDAITRCAYGLYKDHNVFSYGINPLGYSTDMLLVGCTNIGITMDQFAAMFNAFPIVGNPNDIGQVTAAIAQGGIDLEPSISYMTMPIPPELLLSTTIAAPSSSSSSMSQPEKESASILFSSSIHGADVDALEFDAMKLAWATKLEQAYDCNGRQLSDDALERICRALSERCSATSK